MDSSPRNRDFFNATPVRAGRLFFPAAGPNVLHKKPLLGKAGEYFSNVKKPKERLTLLLHTTEKTWDYNVESFTSSYKDVKLLWSWDEDEADDIDDYFRNHGPPLCRHTKNAKDVNQRIGICNREECNFMKTKVLLMNYLKEPKTREAKQKRYRSFFKRFPPSKEFLLFDPSNNALRNNKIIVGGIATKKFRHIGYSNGTEYFSFSLSVDANSKLEAAKNAARPLGLQGKRGSTRRNFILRYIAHSDRDTLFDWWKDISASVTGRTGSDSFAKISTIGFSSLNGFDRMDSSWTPSDDSKLLNVQRYADKRYHGDRGTRKEVFEGETNSTLPMEALFHHMVQTKNVNWENRDIPDKVPFDASLFPVYSIGENQERRTEKLQKVSVATESNGEYGNDSQTSRVSAKTEFVSDKSWARLGSMFGWVLKSVIRQENVTKFFSNFDNKDIKREFELSKKYSVKYFTKDYSNECRKGEPESFTIVYNSIGGSEKIDQVAITVKDWIERDGVRTKINPMASLQREILDPNGAPDFTTFDDSVTDGTIMIYNNRNAPRKFRVEAMTRNLLNGVSMGELRLLDILAQLNGTLQASEVTDELLSALDAVEMIACSQICDNVVVLEACIDILLSKMIGRHANNADDVVDNACKALVRVASSLKDSYKNTPLLMYLFKKIQEGLINILSSERYVILDKNVECAERILALSESLFTDLRPSLIVLKEGFESNQTMIANLVFESRIAEKTTEKTENLEKIERMIAENNKEGIEEIEVPYVLKKTKKYSNHNSAKREWLTSTYSEKHGGFLIGGKTKRLINLEDFRAVVLPSPKSRTYAVARTRGNIFRGNNIELIREIRAIQPHHRCVVSVQIKGIGEKTLGSALSSRLGAQKENWAVAMLESISKGLTP